MLFAWLLLWLYRIRLFIIIILLHVLIHLVIVAMCSCGPPHMANQKQDDQLEHSYSSYVMIRDVTLKTYRRRWMIGRRGERESGISVLAARHDDDDDYCDYCFLVNFYLLTHQILKIRFYVFLAYTCKHPEKISLKKTFWRKHQYFKILLVVGESLCYINLA